MNEIKLCDDGVQNFIEVHTRSVLIDYDRWLRRELAKYGIVIPEDATPDELQRLACEYRLDQFDVGFETWLNVSGDMASARMKPYLARRHLWDPHTSRLIR